MVIAITEIFIFMLLLVSPFCLPQRTNFNDYSALLAIKSRFIFQEPNNILSRNWTSTTNFCNWLGVSCSNQTVVALQLPGLGLKGRIPSAIANLTQLVILDLSDNHFSGPFPSELGLLNHLRVLNVTFNSLTGSIPANIGHCQNLEELYISDNRITGSIPKELGMLSNLRALRLNNNNLTGAVPSSLGNFSKLQYIYLHENNLEGEIPPEIGGLNNLRLLSFRGNDFTGPVHPSIFNISTLQIVDLSINRLSGQLPQNLGNRLPDLERLFLDTNRITGRIPVYLSNATKLSFLFFTENGLQGTIPSELGRLDELQWFELEYNQVSGNLPTGIFNSSSLQILKARHNYLTGKLPADLGVWVPNIQELFFSHNRFTGEIPPSISNASQLVYLEVSNNSLSGPIPMMLGNLIELKHLNLQDNLLVNQPDSTHLDFMNSLQNCRKLEYLIVSRNTLNGIIPNSIGNLSSTLKVIDAEACKIKGRIPQELGNLSSLIYLGLAINGLIGNIPSSIVGLQNLERLYLTRNMLEGTISAELCSIKRLGILHLGENKLSGSLPSFIENLTELVEFSISFNSFNSTIPLSFWRLVRLEGLNLSQTFLHGFIPQEVGNLKAVTVMDLSSNNFSGDVPSSIGFLQSLISLDMSRNSFQGVIPDTLKNLIVLESLDMSSNALSGTIPESLELLRDLKYLNLSYNNLQGKIPKEGVFKNLSYISLMGNPQLCGEPKLNFSVCPAQTFKSKTSHILKITLPILAAALLIIICFLTFYRKKNMESAIAGDSSPRTGHQIITYNELSRATDGYSEENLIGRGSSSKVYKGTLSDGRVAAIKVLDMQWEGALRNFDAECEVMRNARHRNLVTIISTCSNLDFKAMVLDFMPNGTLYKWLYSKNNPLNLAQRLDIVTDVAMAMEYLHHDCIEPIVHCDLKPSNVLLDEDMTAHVADFGIAKVLAEDQPATLTRTLGTIGYIAPEYGVDGHVSTSGDVYSFGVLVLETLTAKKPTSEMFTGDLSLIQWIQKSFPEEITKVLDSNLLDGIGFQQTTSDGMIAEKVTQIEQIIHVALLCLKDSPEERINMREVVVRLKKIKRTK